MSNCIEFQRGTHRLSFNTLTFDVAAFHQEVDKHKDCGDPFRSTVKHSDDWYREHGTYDWFLTSRNCHFSRGDQDCQIDLGQGYSSHCWRDFKHVLIELSRFVRPGKKICLSFLLADEYDGFRSVMRHGVILPTTVEKEFPPYKPVSQPLTITKIR